MKTKYGVIKMNFKNPESILHKKKSHQLLDGI